MTEAQWIIPQPWGLCSNLLCPVPHHRLHRLQPRIRSLGHAGCVPWEPGRVLPALWGIGHVRSGSLERRSGSISVTQTPSFFNDDLYFFGACHQGHTTAIPCSTKTNLSHESHRFECGAAWKLTGHCTFKSAADVAKGPVAVNSTTTACNVGKIGSRKVSIAATVPGDLVTDLERWVAVKPLSIA
jgi:hypothetical protein